jgi:hypothetical protein
MTRFPAYGSDFEGDGAPLPLREPSHIHVVRPSRRRKLLGDPGSRPPADCCTSPEERAELGDR